MRLMSTFARLGVVGLLGLLLAVLMDPVNWDPVTGSDSMTTLEFATAVLNDWAFTLVVLGALLAMAMAGAAYLVRDERKTNLMWELHGGEEE
jgi:NADH:ubiquinone oxidoreductase subunit 6 (subunit J)